MGAGTCGSWRPNSQLGTHGSLTSSPGCVYAHGVYSAKVVGEHVGVGASREQAMGHLAAELLQRRRFKAVALWYEERLCRRGAFLDEEGRDEQRAALALAALAAPAALPVAAGLRAVLVARWMACGRA